MRYRDDLCGNGLRILEPYLESDILQLLKPEIVVGVDGMDFSKSAEGKPWRFIQADLTDPDVIYILAKALGRDGQIPADLITNMWSGINDNDPLEQEAMLILASLSLRKAEEGVPGGCYVLEVPMDGYMDQMIEIAKKEGLHELGKALLRFPTDEGFIDKMLEIITKHSMVQRAKDAGFRILNFPPGGETVNVPAIFYTGAGKPRMIVVLERVGDPVPSLAMAHELEKKEGKILSEKTWNFLYFLFQKDHAWTGTSE